MRVLASIAAASSAHDPHGEPQGDAYQLMQAQLHEHMRTLSGIQSVERKIEAKRAMLADFDAYLDGVLEADAGGQDLVVATLVVWCIDTGAWDRAMQLANYAVRHNLKLPDRYQRDLATLLIDEVSEAALAGKLIGEQAMLVLACVDKFTSDRDAPDQARAKLYKARGYALMGKTPKHDPDIAQLDQSRATFAFQHLTRAHELFDRVGVKKDMERLERRIKVATSGTD